MATTDTDDLAQKLIWAASILRLDPEADMFSNPTPVPHSLSGPAMMLPLADRARLILALLNCPTGRSIIINSTVTRENASMSSATTDVSITFRLW